MVGIFWDVCLGHQRSSLNPVSLLTFPHPLPTYAGWAHDPVPLSTAVDLVTKPDPG